MMRLSSPPRPANSGSGNKETAQSPSSPQQTSHMDLMANLEPTAIEELDPSLGKEGNTSMGSSRWAMLANEWHDACLRSSSGWLQGDL